MFMFCSSSGVRLCVLRTALFCICTSEGTAPDVQSSRSRWKFLVWAVVPISLSWITPKDCFVNGVRNYHNLVFNKYQHKPFFGVFVNQLILRRLRWHGCCQVSLLRHPDKRFFARFLAEESARGEEAA